MTEDNIEELKDEKKEEVARQRAGDDGADYGQVSRNTA